VWRWQDYLERKYSTIANLNSNWGTDYTGFDQAKMPVEEHDWVHFKSEKWSWRWWFFSQNYTIVADYLLLHGRAIMVTLVYVSLAILTALTINPMAAYALSRFQLPGTYKILLFCMATMAFPAAVTMIPSFLLIKNLGMLNTFWALVLPGAASGYNIFLLKGFFDSLPKELYEAARIDGASEARMFLQVTVPLSKPILALIALQAFTGAYGRFMFAFIICQDPKMWTIMVFLYQFQQQMSISIVFAALTLACIPTLLLFIFCQNIILRGIIVPMEK
jgi:ABC-type glycerol-3-phosphate transport system permease component